jgi:hypothetical protein
MFGLGLRYKLERAETALRAALAERDDYLRQLAVGLASAMSSGGSVTTFAASSIASNARLTIRKPSVASMLAAMAWTLRRSGGWRPHDRAPRRRRASRRH